MRRIPIFLVLILCAAAPAFGQSTGNLPLVGVLRINTPDNVEPFPSIFREALAALGQVDGATSASGSGSPRDMPSDSRQ